MCCLECCALGWNEGREAGGSLVPTGDQNLGRRAMLFVHWGSSVCVGAYGRLCTGGALAGPSQGGICRVGRDSPECGTARGGGRVTSRSPVPAATPPTAVACHLLPSQILPPLNTYCLCPHSTSVGRSHPEIPLSRLPVPVPRAPRAWPSPLAKGCSAVGCRFLEQTQLFQPAGRCLPVMVPGRPPGLLPASWARAWDQQRCVLSCSVAHGCLRGARVRGWLPRCL